MRGLVGGWEDGLYSLEEMEETIKAICVQAGILSEDGCHGVVDNYSVAKANEIGGV